MPPADEIQTYVAATWRAMTGRAEALRALDISADGFWNSFFAIVVALPVLLVGWVPLANDLAYSGSGFGERFAIVLRLAIVDIGTWIIPLVLFGLVAAPAGLKSRYVPYVVATNWGSVVLAWLMLPASLIRLVWPDAVQAAAALSLGIFLASMVLLWRLTNAAIGKGPSVASAVFAGMLLTGLAVLFLLQGLLGVSAPAQ
jgi:hypothetical protein